MTEVIIEASSTSPTTSLALQDLADELSSVGISSKPREVSCPATKDGGLLIALAVGQLALAAIGTFVSVLAAWRAEHEKYRITIQRGGVSLEIDNPSATNLQKVVAALQSGEGELIRVRVSD